MPSHRVCRGQLAKAEVTQTPTQRFGGGREEFGLHKSGRTRTALNNEWSATTIGGFNPNVVGSEFVTWQATKWPRPRKVKTREKLHEVGVKRGEKQEKQIEDDETSRTHQI